MSKTITFSEKSKGWTSFWSYVPDLMLKLNNRFYSIKNGQLHLHNEDTGESNTFYGVKYPSKVKMVINELGSEDKIFKTIVLEGNKPWDIALKTNLANSTIKSTEFQLRESRYFAHTRKNENENDFHGNTVQGIGVIQSVTTVGAIRTIQYNSLSQFVSTGDKLYQLNGNQNQFLGIIDTIDFKENKVTIQIPVQARKHTNKFNQKYT